MAGEDRARTATTRPPLPVSESKSGFVVTSQYFSGMFTALASWGGRDHRSAPDDATPRVTLLAYVIVDILDPY
jgi:hypothetical protein